MRQMVTTFLSGQILFARVNSRAKFVCNAFGQVIDFEGELFAFNVWRSFGWALVVFTMKRKRGRGEEESFRRPLWRKLRTPRSFFWDSFICEK